MSYLPQNFLMDYQRMRTEALLNNLKAASALQNQLAQPMQKEQGADSMQDLNGMIMAMNALNARMSLQQMGVLQQPEQILISQLTVQNELLQQQVKNLSAEKERLAKDLKAVEEKLKPMDTKAPTLTPEGSEKKKRHRRAAREITREFRCPKAECLKSYGSEGSLNQHIRLKHPEIEIPKSSNGPNKQTLLVSKSENRSEDDISNAPVKKM